MILRRRIMAAVLFSWLILVLAAAYADTLMLPEELKTIGEGAFQGDASLDEVVIPDGVIEIPANAFAGSSVKKVHIPSSVVRIAANAFDRNAKLQILAPGGSYAAQYALSTEGIGFEYEIVTFGNYPQGENGETAPIEWITLGEDGDRVLLLSRYGLDAQPYHDTESETRIPWKTCKLRQWLNNTFYMKAFTWKERGEIIKNQTDNSAAQGIPGLPGSDNTEDNIFLLSYQEAKTLFPEDEEWVNPYRATPATAYAEIKGVWNYKREEDENGSVPEDWIGIGKCVWWLRSPGRNSIFPKNEGYATYVYHSGTISDWSNYRANFVAVRPALWVKREAIAR